MGLDTQVNGVASLTGTFLFLTTATLALRFLARYKQKARISLADYLAVAAWLGFVGFATLSFYGITHKFMGYPEPKDMAIVEAQHYESEYVYISINVVGAWTFGTAKLSALFFYRRIFCTGATRDAFHYTTLVLIALCFAWTVIFFVMPLNLCGRHSVKWDIQPDHYESCKLTYPYFKASSISDFILDALVLGMPIPKIWSLHATTSRKFAISGVFLLALAGLGASCARMVIYTRSASRSKAANKLDGYQVNTQAAYYAFLEGGVVVVCISLPSLWYFAAGVTVERVLNSVRSVVSLRSNHSSQASRNASRGASTHPHQTAAAALPHDLEANSSRSNLGKNSGDSYAMTDLEPVTPITPVAPVIGIQHKFERTEELA